MNMHKKYSELKKEIQNSRYQDIKLVNGEIIKNFDTSKIKFIRVAVVYYFENGESKAQYFYETILDNKMRYEIDISQKNKLKKILELFNVEEIENVQ